MIIDTFLYFNEEELVDLRINYLKDVVDYFVVIEADTTHQGKPKKWNFEKLINHKLLPFKNKIKYHKLKIDQSKVDKNEGWIVGGVEGGTSWKIENLQRNYIKDACKEFSKEDIILISDVDEIPSKNKIKFIDSFDLDEINPVAFEQFLFHINCNYLNLEKWIGTVATKKKNIDKYKPQELRNHRHRISMLAQAGWSFSSFGGVEKIKEKFEAFAHVEYNNEQYKNSNHIQNCILNGADLFHRKIKKKKIDKNFFPKDLLKLMEENSSFFF